jgi:hypothetical protein
VDELDRVRQKVREQRKGSAPSGGPPGPEGAAGAPVTAAFPDPVPASALKLGDPNGDWFWHGYFGRYTTTLLSSLWKVGKTTLIAHLLKALDSGGLFCGRTVRPTRVLYVTEEPESIWARRRDKIGIGDHVHFQVRPFQTRATQLGWLALITHLRKFVEAGDFGLVMIDPLTTLWPVEKENEAGEVASALMPLQTLTEKAGVVLSHHFRKSDGAEATGARGSGALPGYVDTILELRRYAPTDRKDNRRIISGYGRFEETPDELVIELTDSGYISHGDKQAVKRRSLTEVIRSVLPSHAPGWTWEAVKKAVEDELADGETCPGKGALLEILNQGATMPPIHWTREGQGVKGDPYRYRMS